MVGHGREEAGGQRCECTPRQRVRDVDGPVDPGFGARDDGNRPGLDRRGDKILAIDLQALKSPEDSSGSDLAIVDRKACHQGVPGAGKARLLAQLGQLHLFASGISGLRSVMSTSRVSSGRTPISGPMRGTSRPTIGAAFQAAVR